MRKSREQLEREAIAFNPKIRDLLKADPDYCIRGYVHDVKTNEYISFNDFIIELRDIEEIYSITGVASFWNEVKHTSINVIRLKEEL